MAIESQDGPLTYPHRSGASGQIRNNGLVTAMHSVVHTDRDG
jgi:hypothetical protein